MQQTPLPCVILRTQRNGSDELPQITFLLLRLLPACLPDNHPCCELTPAPCTHPRACGLTQACRCRL